MTEEFKVYNQESVNEKNSGNLEMIIWYYIIKKARSELKVRKQVIKYGFRE